MNIKCFSCTAWYFVLERCFLVQSIFNKNQSHFDVFSYVLIFGCAHQRWIIDAECLYIKRVTSFPGALTVTLFLILTSSSPTVSSVEVHLDSTLNLCAVFSKCCAGTAVCQVQCATPILASLPEHSGCSVASFLSWCYGGLLLSVVLWGEV